MDQRVREPVAARGARLLADELRRVRLLEGVEHVDARERVEPLEHLQLELAARHRGELEHPIGSRPQPGEPPADDVPDALRDRQAAGVGKVLLIAGLGPIGLGTLGLLALAGRSRVPGLLRSASESPG